MIGRDVGEHRDVGHKPGRQIDLIGRHFQHIDRAAVGGARSRTGLPILPPISGANPARERMCPIKRRRRRFAVGARDGDHRRAAGLRAIGPDFAREQFDVADDFDARVACAHDDHRCGAGCVSGTPGLRTSALMLVPRPLLEWRNARAGLLAAAARAPRALSSHAKIRAPPAFSARTDEMPERASPNTATSELAKERAGIIAAHLSFSVERPTSASTTAMIQKRMTIVGSRQPSCSKW